VRGIDLRISQRARALLCGSLAAIGLAVVAVGAPAPASASHTQVSFGFFESNLMPFGSWHVSGSYGRVWIPSVHVIGWHPYAYGHWVYSDVGWAWVSDYEWGAIPYHYGTWALDSELGWVWVPGYVWAPAWVVFRSGPSYVGWAPVPPGFSVGVSFEFADYGADHFVFVREGDFCNRDLHRVAVPVERTRVVFNDTRIVNNNLTIENNVVVNRGIDVQRVERVARAPIERERIERVPMAAPGEHVTREELRVDPKQMERGRVRASAPAPAERQPERAPDVERGRQRQPEKMEPRREPTPEQAPQRAPEVDQPRREQAPERGRPHEPQIIQPRREQSERGRQHEPEVMQPRREPPREHPQAEPERERPQAAPQPEPPHEQPQPRPAPQQRSRQHGGPPDQGGPGPDDPQQPEHGHGRDH
jgi:hypothetical protein